MIFAYDIAAITDYSYNAATLELIPIAELAEMAESPMVGARVPQDWQQQIIALAAATGRKEAEIVRDAIAQYLGKTEVSSVKGAIADLQDRVASLEGKLAGLGRLVG